MAIDWTYFRDQIVINDDLNKEVLAEIAFRNLAPGSTLLLAARDLKHETNYRFRLEGYHIILLADQYDASGGVIDVSGHGGIDGNPGPKGIPGIATSSGFKNRPGGTGGNGTDGTSGTNGTNITLFCRQLLNTHLISNGGIGGRGGRGGDGGKGGDGRGPSPKIEGWEGTDGGNGGNGGNGGIGGNGGQLTVIYVNGINPVLDGRGGGGGLEGSAGIGGKKGFLAENDGAAGAQGRKGDNGTNGQVITLQVDILDFWNRIRGEIGSVADAWAAYRLRVGEYYFRAFIPVEPDHSNYLSTAAGEFMASLMLVPENRKAQILLDQISMNQNILGMPRDFDLVPDFERYERVFTDYAPIVLSMFTTSLELLEQALDVNGNKQRLSGEIRHIEDSLKILDKEKDAADLAETDARANLAMADKRIDAINAEITLNRGALEQHQLEVDSQRIESVFKVAMSIIAVVGAAVTAGASLVAIPGLLVSAQNTWKEFEFDEKTKTVTYRGKHLVDWINWTDENGKLNPKPKPEIEKLIKGLKDVVDKSADIISSVKVLSDIDKSTVDGQLASQYKDLVKKSAELAFDRESANLRLSQTGLLKDAAQMRIGQAQADIQEIRNLQNTINSDMIMLGQIDRMLISRAQEYVNILIKYAFWAARSLEIYTLEDLSGEISYDSGYIHPDEEEKAYLALSRGDASFVLDLMREYIISWNKLPGIMIYRDRYETYRMGLSTDLQFFHFSDPLQLDQFRQSKEFDFSIALNELLSGRFETKVDTVYVSLIGATSDDPRITCILEHSGQESIKRRDGTIVNVMSSPRRAPISASKAAGEFGGMQDPLHASYWGRSPSARWRLSIEPEVFLRSNINLSGLSEIQIAIAYQSI